MRETTAIALALISTLTYPLRSLAAEPNIAVPEKHPYVDPAGGRRSHEPIASEQVNEARVYDFYQRQADYYLSRSGGELPEILPAFPGLDAGKHGHWGKHNQNNHGDGRWNEIAHGPLVTQVFFNQDIRVLKGMSIDLGDGLSAVFDPQALCFRSVWSGGFVRFNPFRWGSSRNAEAAGEIWFSEKSNTGWAGDKSGTYHGHYRHGNNILLSYSIGTTKIIEMPRNKRGSFERVIWFPEGGEGVKIRAGQARPDTYTFLYQPSHGASLSQGEDATLWLEIGQVQAGEFLVLATVRGPEERLAQLRKATHDLGSGDQPGKLDTLTAGSPAQFPVKLGVPGSLGKPITAESPFVVDTLGVPFENPYNSVMQLTGIAFEPDGSALVSTLAGEIWKVTGIDESLQNVTWKRYATGFNQPIGLHHDGDGTFVLDRGQITRLHDYNGDGEVDYYENYANDFGGYDRSHTHSFGLHRTADGSFTFVQREDILRTGPDRKTRPLAWGVRNCMGVGGSDELTFVAPQEGTWTPASMIIEVNEGEFYGLPKRGDQNPNIATPLCFIPRGLDNSTGGIVQVEGDRWGPLEDHFVGISYGSGSHYLILRDASGPRPQGATVPLEGDFLAGTMRGAFNPTDGQLYLVGLDGWGDYSTQDGCFHRVRSTGKPFRHPVGFQVHANGIRIDFAEPVSTAGARVFAHQWNYEYAKRYGSPEFSAKNPASLGHDPVMTREILSLDGGRSLFVEIPEIEPVMQMHLRLHLESADGHAFKTDLFPSILHLGPHLEHEALAAPVQGKPSSLALRVAGRDQKDSGPTSSGEAVDQSRTITVNAIGGLQFEQKLITAAPGEAINIVLANLDVMPHNLVLVKPGTVEEVGTASFAMLNDPDAGKKHYIPASENVLAHTFVVAPGSQHTLHFKAPSELGDYPFICTFPGHWQAMRGVLRVARSEPQ